MLAKDPQFQQKLNDTVTRLNSILTNIDKGEGTVGQLVKNPSLYQHADQMITNASDLVTAIRKDPKKYLTIRLKVF